MSVITVPQTADIELIKAEKRAAHIASLRLIADWLAEHPEVKIPYHHMGDEVHIYIHRDARAEMATIARAMGRAEKGVDGDRFELRRQFGTLTLIASARREDVCERVVIGTSEVTVEVPDPEALAALPKVQVTRVVEEVTWVCPPSLLAGTAVEP